MQDIPIGVIRTYSSNTLDREIRFAERDIKEEYKELHGYIREPQIMVRINKNLDRLYRDLKNLNEEKLKRILLCKIYR